MPPVVPQYASPQRPDERDTATGAQRVFDTVAGPNLRLRDNLIQLACVVVGAALGAFVAPMLMGSRDPGAMLIGGVLGALGALLLSGVAIGIIRGVRAAKRR